MAGLFGLGRRRSTARGSKRAHQWDGVEGDGTPVQLVPAWGRWGDVSHQEEARGVNCELPWLQNVQFSSDFELVVLNASRHAIRSACKKRAAYIMHFYERH